MQAARAVASVIGVARDLLAELQQRDAAAFADRAVPPSSPAAIDQPLQFGARNDSLISRTPRIIVSIRNGLGIVRLSAANLDEDGAHGVIKASDCPTFKSHDSRWVNDADYYPKRPAPRHHCARFGAQSVRLLHERHGYAIVLAFSSVIACDRLGDGSSLMFGAVWAINSVSTSSTAICARLSYTRSNSLL